MAKLFANIGDCCLHSLPITLLGSQSYRLALWVKFSADDILKYFSSFSEKTGFDISCPILFSRKNKKNITKLPSAKIAKRVVKVF